jgi:hypothetical protein
MISEGVECFWLMRSPGGPIRILGFETAASEKKAKDKYHSTYEARRRATDMDAEVVWPTVKLLSKEEVQSTWGHLLQKNQRTGRPRAYFEFLDKSKQAAKVERKAPRKQASPSSFTPPDDNIVTSDSLGQ